MISEDDAAEYRHEELMDRERHRLERMGQRGGPDAGEACEHCHGDGEYMVYGWLGGTASDVAKGTVPIGKRECRRCLGTGVQP